MASKKTKNLQLNKWDPKDGLVREEWNQNFDKLDESIGGVTVQLADTAKQNFNQVQTLTMPTLYKNANESLNITTYDGGKEAMHGSVVYIQEGINGYKFWMACTPYSFSNEYVENPSIYCSFDGINWVVPLTGINPLSPAPQTTGEGGNWHNSDTFLLYRKDIKRLEVWWRKRVRAVGDPTAPEIILRRTSLDGKTWTPTEELFRYNNSPNGDNALSPSAVYNEKTGKYKCYLIKSNFNVEVFQDILRCYESDSDAKNWVLKNEFEPTFNDGRETKNWKIWHGEVRECKDGFEWIVTGGYGVGIATMSLFHAYSADGLRFTPLVPILNPINPTIDSKYIYHGMIVKTDKEHIIYYSARDSNSKWTLNRSVVDFSSIVNAQTQSVLKAEDMYSRFEKFDSFSDRVALNTVAYQLGAWGYSNGKMFVSTTTDLQGALEKIPVLPNMNYILKDFPPSWECAYFLGDKNDNFRFSSGFLDSKQADWRTVGYDFKTSESDAFIYITIRRRPSQIISTSSFVGEPGTLMEKPYSNQYTDKVTELDKVINDVNAVIGFIGGREISNVEQGAWSHPGGVGTMAYKINSTSNVRIAVPLLVPEGKSYFLKGLNNATYDANYYLLDKDYIILHNSGKMSINHPNWQVGHTLPKIIGARYLIININKVNNSNITPDEYISLTKITIELV